MQTKFSNPGLRYGTRLVKLILVGLLGQAIGACSEREPGYPAVGEPFPLAAIQAATSISAEPVELGGKTLLINFWATWCAPCRDEMPELQMLSNSLDSNRYAVIGVAVDEDANLVREFLLEYRIRFANFQDRESYIATRLLGIESFPASFVVSPRGIIQRRIYGRRAWDVEIFEQLVTDVVPTATTARSGILRG